MTVRKYLEEPTKCDVCSAGVKYHEHLATRGTMKVPKMIGMWQCVSPTCRALVSCHHGTKNPVGYMALGSLRAMRSMCHKVFDLLWCNSDSPFARQSAYYWMADILKIPREDANISKLTHEQILIVMEASRLQLKDHLRDKEIHRKGSRKSYANQKHRFQKIRKPHVKPTASNYENFIND